MNSGKNKFNKSINIMRYWALLLCIALIRPTAAQPIEMSRWLDNDPELSALLELHTQKRAMQAPEVRQQLNQLISVAITQSSLAQEAELLILAAAQEVNSAARSKLPQISISGQNSYTQTDSNLTSPANGKTGLLMQMQMPLYDSGRVANTVRSREAQYSGAKEKKKIQLQTLAQEVVTACSNYSLNRIVLMVNEKYTERMNRLTTTINEIATIDPGRASELTQAQSRQLQAELSMQMLKGKIAEHKAELERLLPNPDAVDCMTALKYFIDDETPNIDVINIELHPQIAATKLEADSQYAYADQLKASRRLLIQFGVGRSPVNLALSNEYQNTASITATIPVFDGEVTDRSADAAIQRGGAADARADALKDKLRADLKMRDAAAKNAAKRLEKYRELLSVSNKVRADYYIQWSTLGRRSLFELLSMESEQLNLQTSYATSLFELITSAAYIKIQTGEIFKEINLEMYGN